MFTHLHVHTEYSLLDGMGRISSLIQRAKELGMDSLAITDHGVMYGVLQFYQAAHEAGIKPILGCEIYIAPQGRHSRTPADKNHYHLILLAKNEAGYHNLLQLTTKAHLEGFYYKPKVDKELLELHHEGLIALSACPQGQIPRLILEGRIEEAKTAARWYQEVFSDFYLELQEHAIPELETINRGLVALSRDLGLPLVATNDVHYTDQSDAYAHEVLLCIQTNTSIHDPKRIKMPGDSFYLKNPHEMASLFPDLPQALENTQRIAQMCQVSLEFGRLYLPQFPTPPGKTADKCLSDLCWAGLRQRYPQASEEVERRLAYELEVVRQTQFADYFLVVADIAAFTRKNKILLGVRGSAAASLALYCLGVTNIDPLAHRLVFERFLNVERREMPDIDLDFQDDRRDEVIAYVAQTYGHERVAQIITFGTLGAKAAIRDVGRALGMAYSDVDRVARLVPPALNMTIDRALAESPELSTIYLQDEAVKHLVDTAKRLEGVARHASTHAAGVVISREPLIHHVPLQRTGKGEQQNSLTTQFAMEDIARIGLLKMDFLGLANLTILAKAQEIIAQTRGITIDLVAIPLDDPKTFALLASGETTGLFQLESAGMRKYIKELKPTVLGDIAAMIALYRPGPMQHIPEFISKKHGREPLHYPHPALAEILEETYGVIVYQDQVLLIAQTFAGYTLGQADVVRKAMGKKIPAVMREERQHFIAGAIKQGFAATLASQIFDIIEPFAGYAFNKAHSVSYAMIAYQTAYLKANYPAEYMAAVLTRNIGQPDKIAAAAAECHRLGIAVLPPDINRSGEGFTIEGVSAIRFGLAAIKNVGSAAIQPLLRAREEGGPFNSIEDFCQRANLHGVNKRVLESLIKAGALDSLGSRGALLASIDRILSLAQREHRSREQGQATMFDLFGEEIARPFLSVSLTSEDVPPQEKLMWEKELLGVYLSQHPFTALAHHLASVTTTFCGQVNAELMGQRVVVAGIVASVRQLYTRDRRLFVAATIEDLEGSLEVTAWPEVYERTTHLWTEGNILLIEGKVRMRGNQVQLSCDGVTLYQPREEEPLDPAEPLTPSAAPIVTRHLFITLAPTEDQAEDVTRLQKIMNTLREYPGPDVVHLVVAEDGEMVELEFPNATTGYCPQLHERLVSLVGPSGKVSWEEG